MTILRQEFKPRRLAKLLYASVILTLAGTATSSSGRLRGFGSNPQRPRRNRGWVVALLLIGLVSSVVTTTQTAFSALKAANLDTDVLPQDAFVLSSESFDFDTAKFLQGQSGPLKSTQVRVKGQTYSAADIIDDDTGGNSLSRKMVLAFLETRQGLVTKALAGEDVVNRAAGNPTLNGFNQQINWLTNQLAQAFYSYRANKQPYYSFQDGSKRAVPTGTTAPTYAIFSVLALTVNSQAEWETYVGQSGFKKVYQSLFGVPSPSTNPDLAQPKSAIPDLKLPWTGGETWYLTGGPHTEGGTGGPPYHAIDLAPPGDANVPENCTNGQGLAPQRSNHPLKAPHDGRIVDVHNGPDWYYETVNYNGSNWQVRLTHAAPTGRPVSGVNFNQGDPIGYPSNCGDATGVHVHMSTLNNGVLQDIEGTLISGWTVHGDAANPYGGYLSKPGQPNVYVGGALVSDNYGIANTPPATPANLGITRLNSTTATLVWQDNSNNETGFIIERKYGPAGIWSVIAQTGQNVTTYTDNTMQSDWLYYYRVKAHNNSGDSVYSNETFSSESVPVYRFRGEPFVGYFYTANPTNASQVLGGMPGNGWKMEGIGFFAYSPTNCTNRAPVYRFVLKTDGTNHYYTADENERAALIASGSWSYEGVDFCAFTHQVSGSVPVYIFHLKTDGARHFYTISEQEKANVIAGGIWAYDGPKFYALSSPLPVPTSLQVALGSANPRSVKLSWIDNSSNEDNFIIERKTGWDGSWSVVGQTPPNTTTYQDTTVQPSGPVSYFYRIHAANAAINSGNSYMVTINLGSGGVVPVYRLYNHKEHLLLSSDRETTIVISGATDYYIESVAFYAYISTNNQCPNNLSQATYRLRDPASGYHLHTASTVERDRLVQLGWVLEGVPFCAFTSALTPYLVPVYRLFNHISGDHLYTISQSERDQVLTSSDWTSDGILFYAYAHREDAPSVADVVVTATVDNGELIDGNTAGTLSYALKGATSGQTIGFGAGVTTIRLKGALPKLTTGVTLQGSCASPVTLDGSDPNASSDGLTLGGQNLLQGLTLSGFRGHPLVLSGAGNRLICVKIAKN